MKKLNFLKSFMLVIAAFACVALAGTAKVSAAETPAAAVAPTGITVSYDAVKDVLNIKAETAVECLVYVCKDEKAKVFDASKALKVSVPAGDAGKDVTLTKVGSTKADADIKLNKTGYVFVGTVVTGKVTVTPNFVIKPTTCKKLTVNINYNSINGAAAQGDDALPGSAVSAIASASYVPNEGEAQTLAAENLEYSTDGAAWLAATGFTGDKLAALVTAAADGKQTVYFRVKGTTGATTVATRPSAAKKYSIAKQAKAPSIKLDIAKSTLNIKNGMEYKIDKGTVNATGVFSVTASSADTWHVILRNNKEGTATASEVNGATYKPVKFDKNIADTKTLFTTVKVKNKVFDPTTAFGDAAAVQISVRTAATEKKPASAVATLVVLKPAAAPALVADTGIKNGEDSLTASFSGEGLEYVILPSFADVDLSTVKWTKVKEGSIKITAKTKTAKYSTNASTPVKVAAAVVKDGAVLLVRTAGTKQSKTAAPVLPSAYKRINISAVTGDDAPEIGLKLVDPDATTPSGE